MFQLNNFGKILGIHFYLYKRIITPTTYMWAIFSQRDRFSGCVPNIMAIILFCNDIPNIYICLKG